MLIDEVVIIDIFERINLDFVAYHILHLKCLCLRLGIESRILKLKCLGPGLGTRI